MSWHCAAGSSYQFLISTAAETGPPPHSSAACHVRGRQRYGGAGCSGAGANLRQSAAASCGGLRGHDWSPVRRELTMQRMAYRVGDVLRIACPFTPTVVTGVDETHGHRPLALVGDWPGRRRYPLERRGGPGTRRPGRVVRHRAGRPSPRTGRCLPRRHTTADHPRHRGSQGRPAAGDRLAAAPEPESACPARGRTS